MTAHRPDIGALVGSRLCHDLISPIGAIANGVELLRLAGAKHGPEIDLIADSAAQAAARLRFFRVALGAARRGQSMTGSEIASILDGLSTHGRVAMEWSGIEAVDRTEARLVFLLLLCAEAALPQGGAARVDRDGAGWRIVAEGPRVAAASPVWQALTGAAAPDAAAPAEVQFLLAPMAAAALGRTLAVEATPARLVLTA